MSSSAEPSWLGEPAIAGFQQRAEITKNLYEGTSSYQKIEVYDTVPFGRALVLEGAVQTTIRDEFVYHEMLVHPALLSHPAPKRVLVIGGGDGGTLRRVLEHGVLRAVMVELDHCVVDVCAQLMPEIADGALQDKRASVVIGDGIRFVAETDERFDVVLIDSTDPVGPAKELFSVGFYRNVHRILNTDGLIVTQSGSPTLMTAELQEAAEGLGEVFPFARCYLANVPSYPGSLWSFLVAGKQETAMALLCPNPGSRERALIGRRFAKAALNTRYYTPDLHFACFALPRFIADCFGQGAGA